MAAGSHIGFDLDNIRPPTSAIAGLSLVLKFGLDPIYSFGDIAIFICWCFSLKLSFYVHFWAFEDIYFSQMTSPIVLTSKRTVLVRKHVT